MQLLFEADYWTMGALLSMYTEYNEYRLSLFVATETHTKREESGRVEVDLWIAEFV